jgi:hypothetical protein
MERARHSSMAAVFSALSALAVGCAPAPRAAPPSAEEAYARVIAHASEDFDCPPERITPAPCVCSGAFALNVCDVDAVYGYSARSDGGLDVVLVSAVPPRRR